MALSRLARTVRTVRHLTAEQWLFRAVCRGKRMTMRYAPDRAMRRTRALADALPLPHPPALPLRRVAGHVLTLQQAVHGQTLDGIPDGRFTFLNRTVDFGGIDHVEWRRDLGEANNPLWRMNLAYFGWAVPLLARGAADAEAAHLVRRMLDSLVVQNPFQVPGVFRDVWNAYTASHRCINLLSGLSLHLAAGGRPEPEVQYAILDHARLCAAFVLRNLERDLQYNHLLKNYVALAVYGASASRGVRRLDFLERAVPRSVEQQVLPDGGHAERAPMYHVLSILDLRILRDSGLFPDAWHPFLDERVNAMEQALGGMTLADGMIALFNDSWHGEGPPAHAVLPEPPPEGRMILPDSGYVRLSHGGDSVVFDCGPCGPDDNPGHAHADFLAVEATMDGQRLLVDPGVPTYSMGALRDLSRSAERHNGPHCGGLEPIEFWASFRVGRRGRAHALPTAMVDGLAPLATGGWHDGYAHEGVLVVRVIALWPGQGLLIVDGWSGRRQEAWRTRLTIPTDVWRVEGDSLTSRAGGHGLHHRILAGREVEREALDVWPRFGDSAPACGLVYAPEPVDGQRGVLALWLGRREGPPAAREDIFQCLFGALNHVESLRPV